VPTKMRKRKSKGKGRTEYGWGSQCDPGPSCRPRWLSQKTFSVGVFPLTPRRGRVVFRVKGRIKHRAQVIALAKKVAAFLDRGGDIGHRKSTSIDAAGFPSWEPNDVLWRSLWGEGRSR